MALRVGPEEWCLVWPGRRETPGGVWDSEKGRRAGRRGGVTPEFLRSGTGSKDDSRGSGDRARRRGGARVEGGSKWW